MLKFIDSTRFKASSLSSFVNNLAERIHKNKCKYEHNNKNCKTCRIKDKDSSAVLNRKTLKII